jgi:replication factor C large subunit
MKSINWAEKYRPKDLDKVVGHPTAIEELREWAISWEGDIPQYNAIILYGKPGTGKTSSAHALANDMMWEVLELNASDQRTAKIIEKIAGSGSRMKTLSGSKRLIILDEADNIYGTADRGGEKAIIGLIKKTNHPIILIANELFDMSYGLRSPCKLIQFRPISYGTILSILENIAQKEGVTYERGVLEKIAENADGDLRGAINDLQAIVQGKTDKVKIEIKDVITGQRDTKEDIFKALGKIFRGTDMLDAYRSTFNLDQDPEDLIQWIDQNLPQEYAKPVDLANAYSYLSEASLFLGRVRRRQNYGLWKYASVLMTAGVTVAKSQSHKQFGFVKFQNPAIRKRLSETKGMRKIRDSLAKKIGDRCHTSIRFARNQLFPFLRFIMRDESYALSIAASLDLNVEEIAFLTEKNTKNIYDDAQSIIKEDTEHSIEISGGFGRGKIQEKIEENKEKKEKDKSQSSLFDF